MQTKAERPYWAATLLDEDTDGRLAHHPAGDVFALATRAAKKVLARRNRARVNPQTGSEVWDLNGRTGCTPR